MNHNCLHNNHNYHNHSHFGIIGYNVFGSETLKRWGLNLNSRVTFKFCYFLLFSDCECIEKSPPQNEGSIIRRIFAMCVPCWILNANLSMVLLNSLVRARVFLSDVYATVQSSRRICFAQIITGFPCKWSEKTKITLTDKNANYTS